MTNDKPSNLPTVYMLDVSTLARPSFVYQSCKLPPPLSGPLALKSKSTFHSGFVLLVINQTALIMEAA